MMVLKGARRWRVTSGSDITLGKCQPHCDDNCGGVGCCLDWWWVSIDLSVSQAH